MSEFIEVPICVGFDLEKIIGHARILKDSIPEDPNWVLSLGIVAKKKDGEIVEYHLMNLGLITDVEYKAFLNESNNF